MKKVFTSLFFSLILLCVLKTPLYSQTEVNLNYVVTQYGLEEGLPQSSVNDIIQTKDGYLWLATFGGLVRFDGHSFTTYNRSNTEGMKFDRVIQLYEDFYQNIWIRAEEGILKFKDGAAIHYSFPGELSQIIPATFHEDSQKRLWVSVNNKVFRFDGEKFNEIEVQDVSNKTVSTSSDTTGVLLFFEKKLLKTIGDSVYTILNLEGTLSEHIAYVTEYPVNSGIYFLATAGDGILKYEQGMITYFDNEQGLPSKDIWSFYTDSKNQLWVNAYGGTTKWDGELFQPFDVIKLPVERDLQLTAMFEDMEGNLWMGSSAEGLFKIKPSNIRMIDNSNGLFNQKMLSLTQLNNGTYLFATNCGGVYEYKNNLATPSPVNKTLPNQCIWSVYQDSKGSIWYGSQALYRTNASGYQGEVIAREQGFNEMNVFAIKEDRNGTMWIGTSSGITLFKDNVFSLLHDNTGNPFPETRTFFEDTKGRMWVGTVSGLFLIEKEEVKRIDFSELEVNESSFNEPYIRAIHEDINGVMWFGSYGQGIYRIDGEDIIQIREEEGLFDNIVSNLVEDSFGNFWTGSNRGISRVSREELNKFSRGEIDEVISFSYGTGEGMNSNETNGGFYPSFIQNEENEIFFPTVSGVVVISTRSFESESINPNVYIENLRTGEGEIPYSKEITLPYNNSFLEVSYTGVHFSAPEKTEFRYKLSGLNENWIEVGSRREALYSKIPPGKYTFIVNARNSNRAWSTKEATLNITITPPFWRTWIFYLFVSLMLVSAGMSVYYVRIRTLEKENEDKKAFTTQLIESQESERRRIAAELHDGLGQQILVIKNRVEIAKLMAEEGSDLDQQLDEIRHSATRSIEDVRNISHALRPVVLEKFGLTDAIINLCEQLVEVTGIDWSFHIDPIDDAFTGNNEIIFYRVLQEGINNILKHSGATNASLIVQRINEKVIVTLYDDGIGFETNTQQIKNKGFGLLGIKERIEILNGEFKVESNSESGTTIKISITTTEQISV